KGTVKLTRMINRDERVFSSVKNQKRSSIGRDLIQRRGFTLPLQIATNKIIHHSLHGDAENFHGRKRAREIARTENVHDRIYTTGITREFRIIIVTCFNHSQKRDEMSAGGIAQRSEALGSNTVFVRVM